MCCLDLTSAIQPSWHNAASALTPCRPMPYGLAIACLLLAESLETGLGLAALSALLQSFPSLCPCVASSLLCRRV